MTPSATRRFDRVIIGLFIVTAVTTLVIATRTLSGVRASAAETDRRMRTLAWATLAYASEYGVFPQSAEELTAFGLGPETLSRAADGDQWPATRSAALEGKEPATLDDSFVSILVVFGDNRGMAPFLKPDGLPTTIGTGPRVNGWLEAFASSLERPAGK